MTDENNSLVIEAGADPQALSYTPDAPEPKPEPKPISSREALEKAMTDLEAKGVKVGNGDDKAEPEKKADEPVKEPKARAENGKFAPNEPEPDANKEPSDDNSEVKAEQDGEPKERSSEERDIDKPPARFLPRAKEKWADVDPDVKGEVYRAIETMQKGIDEGREDRQYRKELREFDELAASHGTTVKQALAQYTAIDKLLNDNPIEGIERVLKSIDITPEQYANHVLNNPRQQVDPNVSRLEQTVQQLQQQLQGVTQSTQQQQQQQVYQEIENTLFNEVREEHPRFDELREDVAFFYNSDKLSSITDGRQRLFAAVDMAERVNPESSSQTSSTRLNTAPPERPINPAGAKSIKGAPTGTSVPKSANLNSREAVEAAMRKLGFA